MLTREMPGRKERPAAECRRTEGDTTMLYRTRPGVILASVCGEYVLVGTKEARKHCPYMTQINETSAFLWRLLADGSTPERLQQAVLDEYEVEDPEEAARAIGAFLDELDGKGYLLREA